MWKYMICYISSSNISVFKFQEKQTHRELNKMRMQGAKQQQRSLLWDELH